MIGLVLDISPPVPTHTLSGRICIRNIREIWKRAQFYFYIRTLNSNYHPTCILNFSFDQLSYFCTRISFYVCTLILWFLFLNSFLWHDHDVKIMVATITFQCPYRMLPEHRNSKLLILVYCLFIIYCCLYLFIISVISDVYGDHCLA